MTNSNRPLPPVLAQQLARVLRRYRRVRFLRASARFLAFSGAAAALLALAAAGGAPVAAISATAVAAVALLAAYCFLPILRCPATLQEIAAHIDARHPELQDRILSAVALAESGGEAPSAWMLENLLAETQQRVTGTPLDDFINPLEYRVLVAAVCAGGVVIAAGLIAAGWRWSAIQDASDEETAALAAAPFTVEPGNATVQPGDNQIIWVTSPDVNATKYIHWEQGGREQRAVLASSSTPEVSFHTFEALREGLFYRVRVGERESERYEIRVARPPSVESIQITYTYPAYLRLEPRVVPFAGDIEAVEGTEVALRVEVNKPLRQAVLALDTGSQIPLAAAGELAWETVFTLEESGDYRVALLDEAGDMNPMPARYAITALPDNPPAIKVRYPRGDTEVLALEEVPLAFTVEDDFGVSAYGIEYTIAGQEPVRLALNGDSPLAREIVGDHLFALEELGLQGGDLVTWSVWATDLKPDRADFEVVGDPFFLEVRPYVRRYRESITNAGGGAAAGEAGQGRDPLGDQRGVVIALHNLRKRASGLGEESYTTDAGRIAEAQAEIRGTLEGALGMAPPDRAIFGRRALESMTTVEEDVARAAWPEPEEALGEALAAAQEAMQWLKKLEPELRDVMRAQGGGGGGGGGGGSAQGEIDQLELARRTGFQEEARTSQQAAAEQEALRKGLEDLARRQEVLNEDLGALLSENEAARDERERARQLERLREEQQRQLERLDQLANELARSPMDAAQREEAREALQEARRNMETSAESARRGELQQARSAGSRAARDLESVERNLDMLTREAAADRLAALEEGMRGLRERQAGVREEVDALREMESLPGLEGQERLAARSDQLRGEKELLARDTEALIRDAGGLSDQLRQNQELLSRKLGDWARRTSRDGVVTDMESGLRYVEWGAWEPLAETERQVDRKLEQAAGALEGLRRYLPGDEKEDLARALDMLQELGGVSEEAGEASEAGETGEAGAGGDSRAETDAEAGRGDGASEPGGDGASSQPEAEARETLARRPDAPGDPVGQGDPSAEGEASGPGGAPQDGERTERGQESGEGAVETGAPGETASAQSGGANGDTPGEGAAPGEGGEAPGGEGGESGREGARADGARGDGASGIQTSDTFRGGGADSRDDFFDQDIWDWRPTIRDAASLLPRESSVRGALEQVEMDLGRLQREYNNGKQLPDAGEFEQVVRRPLRDAIAALEDEVRARLDSERQWIEDEGAIPPQYADRVSEYFRTLADTPAAP